MVVGAHLRAHTKSACLPPLLKQHPHTATANNSTSTPQQTHSRTPHLCAQVKEPGGTPGATTKVGGSGGDAQPQALEFQPLSVKRKAVHGNTLTVSQSSMRMALMGNASFITGLHDHQDLGIARNAP